MVNKASTRQSDGRFIQPVPLNAMNTSSPGNRDYWLQTPHHFFPAMAEAVTSTHCACPHMDSHDEWAWVAWIYTGMVDLPKVDHHAIPAGELSSNSVRFSVC